MSQTVLLRPTATGRGGTMTTRPPKPPRRLLCVGIRVGKNWAVRIDMKCVLMQQQKREAW